MATGRVGARGGPGPRQPGLVFWDTDPNDGIRYGGDLDHTGVYIGNGQAIDTNASYGRVKYDTVAFGGNEREQVPWDPGCVGSLHKVPMLPVMHAADLHFPFNPFCVDLFL
ncbi:hypothetical protein [Streptomyces sp. bgisy082]|uniref:hypothetical protein n=1 Tax=Streptomyces sp. bgisy082 TaxID=3413776 RepID=UPI003D7292B5